MSHSLLLKRQQQFMAYLTGESLTGESSDIADHIVDQGNIPVHTRLNIYHNAYNMRLKETIETDHEILGVYLGDELFDEMVSGYIRSNPSNHTSLRQFADRLPHYLATTQPFADHPLISELAAFERLLLTAFDAAEACRMSLQQLTAIPVEGWPTLGFTFHPSMQIFKSQWNTVASWQALKAGHSPDPAQEVTASWLIWRNTDRLSEFESITNEECQLLELALQGNCFSSLCETLLETHSEQQASQAAVQYLLKWAKAGLLTTNQAVVHDPVHPY